MWLYRYIPMNNTVTNNTLLLKRQKWTAELLNIIELYVHIRLFDEWWLYVYSDDVVVTFREKYERK